MRGGGWWAQDIEFPIFEKRTILFNPNISNLKFKLWRGQFYSTQKSQILKRNCEEEEEFDQTELWRLFTSAPIFDFDTL